MTQAEVDQAIRDQIGANPTQDLPSNPQIQAALADYATEAANVVTAFNNSLRSIYNTAWQNFVNQVEAGRIPAANPPPIPTAYFAGKATNGWTYVIKGSDPLVVQAPMPQISTAAQSWFHIDYVQAVPPGDNMPLGFIVTAPDGTRWQKTSSPTPFGTAYFYAKVT